jgi:flagellin FlaB
MIDHFEHTLKNTFQYFITKLMKLFRKRKRHTLRGITGIETAIVLIAFVIVAASLAFVVLNMGFATTQKSKTSIGLALSEAGSSLTISGTIIGDSVFLGNNITSIMIPIKLVSGGDSVDLNTTKAKISYLTNDVEFDNAYTNACTLNTSGPYASPTLAWADAQGACIGAGETPMAIGGPAVTTAIIYWAVDEGSFNTILEPGEHAVISIGFNQTNDAPSALENLIVELTVTGGATLTVERFIPNINGRVIDLG